MRSVPFRKLFLSRWWALLWAGGILWTAEDMVGFGPPATATNQAAMTNEADTDATGVTVNSDDLQTFANVMQGG